MGESIIYASERLEKVNKVRKEGSIPAVINGKGVKPRNIKLEEKEVIKLLHEHANNAKVSIKVGDKVSAYVVKEIQRDTVRGKIIHIDLQAIHDGDIIRLKVPVIFSGKERLGLKHEVLQENVSEVEVMGNASYIPQSITIDIGDKEYGDKIIAKDITLENGLRILDDESEIIAVVTAIKEKAEEIEETGEDVAAKAN